MTPRRKIILISLFVFVFTVLTNGAAVMFYAQNSWQGPGPLMAPQTLVIAQGAGLRTIAQQLQQNGIIQDRWVFMAMTLAQRQEKNLKPGEYQFSPSESAQSVFHKIQTGQVVMHKFTVVEGSTTSEIIAQIKSNTDLTGDIKQLPNEGDLLPETYSYSLGDTRQDLIDRMQTAMRKTASEFWAKKQDGLPFRDIHDAITLASIVEKETAIAAERPRIAAVFINRLRIGMPLQADPTVRYAMQLLGRDLSDGLFSGHLQTEHPYNTYTTTGLPPGPIANPGRASIEAVLNPLSSNELYFVADGKGGHVFASTLDEHNKNVAAWRLKKGNRE